jgi:hypothetical protein
MADLLWCCHQSETPAFAHYGLRVTRFSDRERGKQQKNIGWFRLRSGLMSLMGIAGRKSKLPPFFRLRRRDELAAVSTRSA